MALPRDYSFIDHARLVSYFQQVSDPDELRKKQKIPNWDVSMSITGPKVGGKQTISLRDPTVYEMIESVESYLEAEQLLGRDPTSIEPCLSNNPCFMRLQVIARKALISSETRDSPKGLDHLAVWIKEYPESRRDGISLYLIESCNESDKPYVEGVSGYTALEFLLLDLEEQTKQFRASLLGTSPSDGSVHLDYERFKTFASDPARYLEKLGAQLGPRKSIDCLFRVRLVFADCASDYGMTGVVGYPVYIPS